MTSVRSNNISLKYQRFTIVGFKDNRDYKIRVCGKDSIPLLHVKLLKFTWISNRKALKMFKCNI